MISSLAELVAPLEAEDFVSLLRDRKLTFTSANGENRYNDLFSWEALRELVEQKAFRPEHFRTTNRELAIPPPFYFVDGKLRPETIDKLLGHGASLIVTSLELYVPAMEAICRDIGERTGDASLIDAVVTTGEGGAFRCHFDCEDLFVVQIQGSKRWTIYGEPLVNPVTSEGDFPEPAAEPIFDRVLQPGDTLVLPSGYLHRCHNGLGRSLHLAVCFKPATGYRAVKSLLARLAEEESFRIPLTRLPDDGVRRNLRAAIKSRLFQMLEETSWGMNLVGKTNGQ